MPVVVIYEDQAAPQFEPLSHLRPVFDLVCGEFSARERFLNLTKPSRWGVWIRPHLQAHYAEMHPDCQINCPVISDSEPVLFLNGRWLVDGNSLPTMVSTSAGMIGDTLVSITLSHAELKGVDWNDVAASLKRIADRRSRVAASGHLVHHPWDLVHHNAAQIAIDFHLFPRNDKRTEFDAQVAVLGRGDQVRVHKTARIDPFVVIDARSGPVSVDEGAVILPFTRLEGPCHIGRETQVFRAHIREGTTIGPVCRVGGEIEGSIIHGYANKYHDGFLGHSYVCPWVNLGAITSNSDLKNDYSNVKVPLGADLVDTGSTKVGCFIGDFTKTAIMTPINTGSNIGVMCMILPHGELLPKLVPSFSRVWHGAIEPLTERGIDEGIAAARTAMGRRKQSLSSNGEALLREVARRTEAERRVAAERASPKRSR